MAFSDDLKMFTVKVQARNQAVFTGVIAETLNSIVFGSPLTGSPGQPIADIDGGNLRASWQAGLGGPDSTPGYGSPRWESNTVAVIGTMCVYAKSNEDGIARPGGGAYRLLASTGGRWSVRNTINGFQRIVNQVTRDLTGAE